MNTDGSGPGGARSEDAGPRHDLGALFGDRPLTPEQEMRTFLQAKRQVVRRNRAAAARLAIGFSLLVAALILWYSSAPVPAGIYPAKVLGGVFTSEGQVQGIRFPVMWVKAYPFQRRPPGVEELRLEDDEGRVLAVATAAEVSLDSSGPLARRVQAWVTLRPVEDGATASTAVVKTFGTPERAFPIGVLHLLGEQGPTDGPVASLNSADIIFPGYGPHDRAWVRLTLGAVAEGAEVRAARTGEFSWLGAWNQDVFRIVAHPMVDEELPDGPDGSRIIITTGGPYELYDWQPCSLPTPIEGQEIGLAVRLASWVGALTSDFFLYVPVELDVRANEMHQMLRGNALDFRHERPWEMFQTVPRVERKVML